jgi:hypothetical protein
VSAARFQLSGPENHAEVDPMKRFISRFLAVVCGVASLFALAERAAASQRPHLSSGTAQFISATDFVGSGQATHLGRYSETGTVAFTPTSDPAVLHVEGSVVYTAADGDKLRADVTGELNALTGVITATLTYTGGSGRFATATGSASLAGQMLSGGAISVSVSGAVDF